MLSYSFGLLKPDCYQRRLTKMVMKMISKVDLYFVVVKTLKLTRKEIECIYYDIIDDWYFEDHAKFMESGPVTVFIVRGDYAIQKLNELVGYNIPSQSASRTIRRFGTNISRNLIHSSSDFIHFVREAQTIFNGPEFDHLYQREYYL